MIRHLFLNGSRIHRPGEARLLRQNLQPGELPGLDRLLVREDLARNQFSFDQVQKRAKQYEEHATNLLNTLQPLMREGERKFTESYRKDLIGRISNLAPRNYSVGAQYSGNWNLGNFEARSMVMPSHSAEMTEKISKARFRAELGTGTMAEVNALVEQANRNVEYRLWFNVQVIEKEYALIEEHIAHLEKMIRDRNPNATPQATLAERMQKQRMNVLQNQMNSQDDANRLRTTQVAGYRSTEGTQTIDVPSYHLMRIPAGVRVEFWEVDLQTRERLHTIDDQRYQEIPVTGGQKYLQFTTGFCNALDVSRVDVVLTPPGRQGRIHKDEINNLIFSFNPAPRREEDQNKKKFEDENKKKLDDELKKKLEDDLKKKLEDENKKKLDDELKKKLEDDLKKKLEDENKKKLDDELKKKQEEEERTRERAEKFPDITVRGPRPFYTGRNGNFHSATDTPDVLPPGVRVQFGGNEVPAGGHVDFNGIRVSRAAGGHVTATSIDGNPHAETVIFTQNGRPPQELPVEVLTVSIPDRTFLPPDGTRHNAQITPWLQSPQGQWNLADGTALPSDTLENMDVAPMNRNGILVKRGGDGRLIMRTDPAAFPPGSADRTLTVFCLHGLQRMPHEIIVKAPPAQVVPPGPLTTGIHTGVESQRKTKTESRQPPRIESGLVDEEYQKKMQ